jgi:hypothetical protein
MSPRDHRFHLPLAAARFAAWWRGGCHDRPPVTLGGSTQVHLPPSSHASLEDRWLDVSYQVECALTRLEATPALGDSVPAWMPNVGPDLVATLYGAQLEFGESTSWCQHTIHEPADWHRFLQQSPDFTNRYWQVIDAMTDAAAARFAGRFYVAMPDLHGNFDILSGLRGPEDLCLDLVDEPELVRRAAAHASRGYVQAWRRCHQRLLALGQPSTTWCSYLHDGPAYVPSCDFWCLVSADVAREFIRPGIVSEMAALERSIFHLDGVQALHHLDLVLGLPGLNAVQWVYGAGHGPARNWIDIYRRCLSAGKAVQVLAEDAADALVVLEALGPAGVWLHVGQPFADVASAGAFLDEVNRLSPRP